MIIEVIKAIFYGIVEGITEWLPISSTGHLILFEQFFSFNASEAFIELYRVVIQLGAILAVVILYWGKLWPFALYSESKHDKHYIPKPEDKRFLGAFVFKWDIFIMWLKIAVGCIPAIVYALVLDDKVSEIFEATIGNTGVKVEFLVVVAMLLIVGVVFIIVENLNKKKIPKITDAFDIGYGGAFIIGIFQMISAALPGTSRSGATIIGALLIGISRPAAAEFTFFLGIPSMFGASLYKGYKFIDKGVSISSGEILLLIISMIVAFAVSMVIIKFLVNFVKKHDFKVFGWYRIVLSAILLLYFAFIIL